MLLAIITSLLIVAQSAPGNSALAATIAGREADARVARVAFRLAEAGRGRCPVPDPSPGLVLQHLTQFEFADRAGVIAVQPLDRGAGVIAVVPGGPADAAGLRAGDVLQAVDGIPLPPEPGLAEPFDPARAQARADAIDDLLARATSLTLLRDGTIVSVAIASRQVCPSRVRLARSGQRNAYADGRHVLVTTGLLALLRSDDELAFVLAHEMAHNVLGHAAVMRGGTVARGIGRALGRSGAAVRGAERDADVLAGGMLVDAGYDPVAGAGVLRRIGRGRLGLLADHDAASRRIATMRALVATRRAP